MSTPEKDVEELWKMMEDSPKSLYYESHDLKGRNLDLLCRAGFVFRNTPVLVEATEMILLRHEFSTYIRPIIMFVGRAIYKSVKEWEQSRTNN